eukprot:904733-Prorocentrum_minimum.AAC.1
MKEPTYLTTQPSTVRSISTLTRRVRRGSGGGPEGIFRVARQWEWRVAPAGPAGGRPPPGPPAPPAAPAPPAGAPPPSDWPSPPPAPPAPAGAPPPPAPA